MPFPLIPLLGMGVGAGLSFLSNRHSAAEAQRNRDFQERMSNTAHQREVEDMRRAGINPILSAHGGGASSPSGSVAEVRDAGEGASRGLASALQLQTMKAQVDLLKAQTRREDSQTDLNGINYANIHNEMSAGKYDLLRNAVEAGRLDNRQKESLLPLVVERAKAEISNMVSSAHAAEARAMLDEAAKTGALNEQKFQEMIGEMGPTMKFFLEMIRGLSPLRR